MLKYWNIKIKISDFRCKLKVIQYDLNKLTKKKKNLSNVRTRKRVRSLSKK